MPDAGSSLTQWAIGLVLGVMGGAGGTLVALRTQLVTIHRDIEDGAAALALHQQLDQAAFDRLQSDLVGHIERLDKRQMSMIKLLADVARKVGVDGRVFDDALVRMLTDDEG